MENENEELDTQTEEVEAVEEVTEPTEEVEEDSKEESTELKTALVQKKKYREKLAAAEKRLAELENKPKTNTALDVEDYIDISSSLSGLDPVEQAFLAKQHKLTGESMKEIRDSEDFQLWNSAYKQKQEAENALKPNAQQEIEGGPSSFTDKLRGASLAEKEELLRAQGLYKDSRPNSTRTDIGNKVSTQ
jgi:hypothetical protein